MGIKCLDDHQIATFRGGEGIVLNFNPLLETLKSRKDLGKSYLLSHWNKILELPAYYCPPTQEYWAIPEPLIKVDCAAHFWAGINRGDNPGILPTSVLVYPSAKAVFNNDGYFTISEAN